MTHNLTIIGIDSESKKWTSADGAKTAWFQEGDFFGGSRWSIWCKSEEEAAAARATLTPLINKPTDYDLEDGGEYRGIKKWKMRGYPGKPETPRSGGGGRAPFVQRYRETAEGFAQEQASIHRSVALTQAVAHVGSANEEMNEVAVLKIAETFFKFLSGSPAPSWPFPSQRVGGRVVAGAQVAREAATDGTNSGGAGSVSEAKTYELTLALTRMHGPLSTPDMLNKCSNARSVQLKRNVTFRKVEDITEADADALLHYLNEASVP